MGLGRGKKQKQEEEFWKEGEEKRERNLRYNMLPKENRLKKKKDFDAVFKQGEGSKEDFLYLKIKKNNLETSRFGFVVSKKFSKKATERNKIKRRLSELVGLKMPTLKKGIDGVIVIMPGLKKSGFRELEESINELFKKSKLLKVN